MNIPGQTQPSANEINLTASDPHASQALRTVVCLGAGVTSRGVLSSNSMDNVEWAAGLVSSPEKLEQHGLDGGALILIGGGSGLEREASRENPLSEAHLMANFIVQEGLVDPDDTLLLYDKDDRSRNTAENALILSGMVSAGTAPSGDFLVVGQHNAKRFAALGLADRPQNTMEPFMVDSRTDGRTVRLRELVQLAVTRGCILDGRRKGYSLQEIVNSYNEVAAAPRFSGALRRLYSSSGTY